MAEPTWPYEMRYAMEQATAALRDFLMAWAESERRDHERRETAERIRRDEAEAGYQHWRAARTAGKDDTDG